MGGECFVFDNRVTVNKRLQMGKYLQCHGCRNPVSIKETKSKYYIKVFHVQNALNPEVPHKKTAQFQTKTN